MKCIKCFVETEIIDVMSGLCEKCTLENIDPLRRIATTFEEIERHLGKLVDIYAAKHGRI